MELYVKDVGIWLLFFLILLFPAVIESRSAIVFSGEGDHAVSRDGCIDLDTDGILRFTPELLDV